MSSENNQVNSDYNKKKEELIKSLSKEEMADMILKDNTALLVQASQLLDVIDIANNIEKISKDSEIKKCNVVKKENEVCKMNSDIQKEQISIYEYSLKTQLVLFILLVIVLSWLMYYLYTKPNKTE